MISLLLLHHSKSPPAHQECHLTGVNLVMKQSWFSTRTVETFQCHLRMNLKGKGTICMAVLITDFTPNRIFKPNPQYIKYVNDQAFLLHSWIQVPSQTMFSPIHCLCFCHSFLCDYINEGLNYFVFERYRKIKSCSGSISIFEVWKSNESRFSFCMFPFPSSNIPSYSFLRMILTESALRMKMDSRQFVDE